MLVSLTLEFKPFMVKLFKVKDESAGSKDERWEDDLIFAGTEVRDYDGGRIIDVRPSIEFKADKDLSFNVYANVEWRRAFDGTKRTSWSSGIFATYTF